jgi:hypothetical protein
MTLGLVGLPSDGSARPLVVPGGPMVLPRVSAQHEACQSVEQSTTNLSDGLQ